LTTVKRTSSASLPVRGIAPLTVCRAQCGSQLRRCPGRRPERHRPEHHRPAYSPMPSERPALTNHARSQQLTLRRQLARHSSGGWSVTRVRWTVCTLPQCRPTAG